MFEFLKTEEKPTQLQDRVIIFDEDQKTCEILKVEAMNEEVVRTADRTIPRADLSLTLSKQGRVFVLNGSTKYIEHTEHLARVEKNTIIRQIAQYNKPMTDLKTDWTKLALLGALVLVSIIAAAT
ncbi:hypothetical protein ABEO98_21630 [Brevibacillus parabrevis]|uniref:hypothetical protein n=1 Tax=Brevibacillus parabrevis TaxID=54914 RepID=UPI002E1EB30C|nr:hypothetical protein [Brevibacillus parabrevis]